MNPFDLLKALYKKNCTHINNIDVGLCLFLNSYLGLDKNNLKTIKDLSPYLFYVNPVHYFYLLYFSVSYSSIPPFLKKPAKKEIKEDPFLDRIQSLLGWTNREMYLNYSVLEQTIFKDEETTKLWKKELAIK